MELEMSRVFSGVQPTGNLHLGNYLGAIKNFVELQDKNECIYCVVDMHAITVKQDPQLLKKNVLEIGAGDGFKSRVVSTEVNKLDLSDVTLSSKDQLIYHLTLTLMKK